MPVTKATATIILIKADSDFAYLYYAANLLNSLSAASWLLKTR